MPSATITADGGKHTTHPQRYEWEDALIDDHDLPDGAVTMALRLARAVNWRPTDPARDGRPGLYWRNLAAAESVKVSRATFKRYRTPLVEAGYFEVVNGNLCPTIPTRGYQIDTPSTAEESTGGYQIDTPPAQIETSGGYQIETSGGYQIETPFTEDTFTVDTLSEDVLSEGDESAGASSSDSASRSWSSLRSSHDTEAPSSSSAETETYTPPVSTTPLGDIFKRSRERRVTPDRYRPSWVRSADDEVEDDLSAAPAFD